MVQAMINISENSNRVLAIVKAKYGLKDKSAAIEMVVNEYEDGLMEPQLRPEYLERTEKASKGPFHKIEDIDSFLGLK